MGLFNRHQLWDTLDDIRSYDNSVPKNSSWGKRRFGAAMAVVSLFVLAGVFGHSEDEGLKKTWTRVQAGNLLYADSVYLSDSSFTQLHTYRRVRPINAVDISKMHIASWEKLKKIAQIDTSIQHNRPVMLSSNLLFLKNDLFKQHTACIGTYVKSDSLTGDIEEKKDLYFPQKWYAIKPNMKLCKTNYEINMPADYTFADEYYYVKPLTVTLTPPSIFSKKEGVSSTAKSSSQLKDSTIVLKRKPARTKKHRSKLKHRLV